MAIGLGNYNKDDQSIWARAHSSQEVRISGEKLPQSLLIHCFSIWCYWDAIFLDTFFFLGQAFTHRVSKFKTKENIILLIGFGMSAFAVMLFNK
jgi:hypothetical protein